MRQSSQKYKGKQHDKISLCTQQTFNEPVLSSSSLRHLIIYKDFFQQTNLYPKNFCEIFQREPSQVLLLNFNHLSMGAAVTLFEV